MRDNRKIRRRQRCPGCGSLEVIKWGVRNGNKGLKACPCRGRWICKMASDGRDFPAKVWPLALSKCRRARKPRKSAPGGAPKCCPPGALQNDRVGKILPVFTERENAF